MPLHLVFKSHESTGHVSQLKSQVFDGAGRGEVVVRLKPSHLADSVQELAVIGTEAAYHILNREGYVVRSILITHQVMQAPDNIQGGSGGLAFALSSASLLLPPEHNLSDQSIVATGVMGDNGKIYPVEGIEEKLRAALQLLPEGGCFVATEENILALHTDIQQQATQQNIQLIAANHLADALKALGVPLRKAYLESPFVGLSAFSYQHAGVFFGRDREINEVIEKLKLQSETAIPC